jgi:proteic killer suppression protein
VDIEFRSGKLRKNCTDSEKAKKAYGVPRARKITQRLQEIQAASDLETLTQLRATGCHPLKGDRKGQFALELPDGFRLIFEPLDENGEAIRKEDFDYKSVRRVKIIDIKDYH